MVLPAPMASARTLTLTKDAASGRKLGKYEVVSRLSEGGMAEIFLAFQRGPGGFKKLVVLKKVLPDVKAEEEAVQMFLDEAKITAAFTHPNIAHVYDLDMAEGELFLAMEFIPGADLVEIAKACADAQEPIPTGFSLTAVRDTAHALHYAHTFTDPLGRARPTIHRDVAEKNIMVTYDGITKLLDFGIAKAQGRATRTAAGMVKGTSGYMSPEQVRGEELDARADVFSLGVVLHEMLTGSRLFYGNDPTSELLAVLDMEVWAPSERNRDVTPELDRVVLKALAKDRKDRFGSALEMGRALEKVSRELIWDQEQCGALVVRHFLERRDQTRQLLTDANADEKTGYVRPPAPAKRRPAQDDGKVVRSGPLVTPPQQMRGSGPKQALKAKPDGVSGPKAALARAGSGRMDERTMTSTETTGEMTPPFENAERTVLRPPQQADRPQKAPARKAPAAAAVNPFAEIDATVRGNTADAHQSPAPREAPKPPRTVETPVQKTGTLRWLVVAAILIILGGLAVAFWLAPSQAEPTPAPRIQF